MCRTIVITITNEGGFYSRASITDDGCGRGVEAHDQATLHGDAQDKIIASIDAGETQGHVVIGGESMTWVIKQKSIVADKIRRFIRVHYDSGNTVDTEIIGTKDDILRYYVGNEFNLGDGAGGDLMAKALRVEFL